MKQTAVEWLYEKIRFDETKIYQNRSVNDEKNDGYIQLSLFD